MVMTDGVSPGPTMLLDRSRRLVLGPHWLSLEVRGGSRNWVPTRTIRYDEILAVFRYETRDWAYLGIALMYWLAAVTTGGVTAAAASLSAATVGWGALIITLVVGAMAIGRISTRPRRLLRIEAHSGAFVFANRDDQFFRSLATRLPPHEAVPHPQQGATEAVAGIPEVAAAEPYALGLDPPREMRESGAPESTTPYLAWPGLSTNETPDEASSEPRVGAPPTPADGASMLDDSPENENRSTTESP